MEEKEISIFDVLDPADLELECGSEETYERSVRALIRLRYAQAKPITAEELPDIRGYTKVPRREPSPDLLILGRLIKEATDRANGLEVSAFNRTLRHAEADSLRQMQRYLLNAEAGERHHMYDLELFGCNGSVVIGTRTPKRK